VRTTFRESFSASSSVTPPYRNHILENLDSVVTRNEYNSVKNTSGHDLGLCFDICAKLLLQLCGSTVYLDVDCIHEKFQCTVNGSNSVNG
jgi:hypothetical protein